MQSPDVKIQCPGACLYARDLGAPANCYGKFCSHYFTGKEQWLQVQMIKCSGPSPCGAKNPNQPTVIEWWPLENAYDRGWKMYIKTERVPRGKHVIIDLCENHHDFFLNMFETEMLQDVKEMEATDRWLRTNRGFL
jgi:hypothetical protein